MSKGPTTCSVCSQDHCCWPHVVKEPECTMNAELASGVNICIIAWIYIWGGSSESWRMISQVNKVLLWMLCLHISGYTGFRVNLIEVIACLLNFCNTQTVLYVWNLADFARKKTSDLLKLLSKLRYFYECSVCASCTYIISIYSNVNYYYFF